MNRTFLTGICFKPDDQMFHGRQTLKVKICGDLPPLHILPWHLIYNPVRICACPVKVVFCFHTEIKHVSCFRADMKAAA